MRPVLHSGLVAGSEAVTGTMQAAVLTGPGKVEVHSAPVREPGERDVLVRLQGCGVCASNLPVWEGRPWFDYPQAAGAPGHEGWGVVERTGAQVERVKPGDRVALLSYNSYAEYDTTGEDCVVKLPPELDGKPFPGEPLGCAMNIFRRSGIRPGQTVAIVGIGFLGALLTSLVSRAGGRVVAISRRAAALDIAREMGAAETLPMDDHWQIVGRVKAITGGEGCERVIEAVGEQWPLDLASDLTRERGRLIVAGYHQDGPRQVNMQSWNWRGLDVINAHERAAEIYVEGIQAAVKAVLAGEFDPFPLFTHTFRLNELPAAFRAAVERPAGFMKGLISYE